MSWLEEIVQKFSGHVHLTASPTHNNALLVDREILPALCRHLRTEHQPAFSFLMDVGGVDRSQFPGAGQRYEVIYNLFAYPEAVRLILRVPVPEADPIVPSVSSIWAGANWYEREIWDLFGIRFKNHPDLRRILMYDEFKGHPLRKDYPINRRHPLISHDKLATPGQNGTNGHQPGFRIKGPQIGKNAQNMLLNMGPSHPAMHGVIHLLLELDGETVASADVAIGYLHRAFEKDAEAVTWNQVFPYTDRLNYVSPLINNVGYAMAVEKLMGLQTTERCQYIRVLMSEISRITDHLTCIGANTMELGAMTGFLYFVKVRDMLYELVEEITGARLTVSYLRIGGVKADLTSTFDGNLRKILKELHKAMKEMHTLVTRNRIFVDRMKATGVIEKETAIAHGFTGPMLRATGIDYDVRKAEPYLVYDRLEFDIPYGQYGDNYDRYLVRMEEIEQSAKILEQCLEQIPGGAINVDHEGKEMAASEMADRGKFGQTHELLQLRAVTDPTLSGGEAALRRQIFPDDKRVVLPAKEQTYGSIEGLMNHFMLVMEGYGIQPPVGEAYQAVEGANGELGFYVISSGQDKPYRVDVRPPCFALMSGFHKLIEGDAVADIVATFGTVNMIAGELDR
ncbi:MAG: NADH-quinone oxidoreductase subunit D [bacterium]